MVTKKLHVNLAAVHQSIPDLIRGRRIRLSTPITKHLRGLVSWKHSEAMERDAFRRAMKGRMYGRDECRDAWLWFDAGYMTAVSGGKVIFK